MMQRIPGFATGVDVQRQHGFVAARALHFDREEREEVREKRRGVHGGGRGGDGDAPYLVLA